MGAVDGLVVNNCVHVRAMLGGWFRDAARCMALSWAYPHNKPSGASIGPEQATRFGSATHLCGCVSAYRSARMRVPVARLGTLAEESGNDFVRDQ